MRMAAISLPTMPPNPLTMAKDATSDDQAMRQYPKQPMGDGFEDKIRQQRAQHGDIFLVRDRRKDCHAHPPLWLVNGERRDATAGERRGKATDAATTQKAVTL
jgi:hypothetical protein